VSIRNHPHKNLLTHRGHKLAHFVRVSMRKHPYKNLLTHRRVFQSYYHKKQEIVYLKCFTIAFVAAVQNSPGASLCVNKETPS
jgi:hypothetical protein